MSVGPDDVISAAEVMRQTLEPAAAGPDDDWSRPAGDLDWSCLETLHHVASCMLTYATQLASRETRGIPAVKLEVYIPRRILRIAVASAYVLAETARAAPPRARAYHPAGMADPEGWCAMGCDEILVHTYDIAAGLGLPWDPPHDLAREVRVRLFPRATGDAWEGLLMANGRLGRRDPDWTWQAAPHG
jgi:hypothetical protein